jgi:hypothetical protein
MKEMSQKSYQDYDIVHVKVVSLLLTTTILCGVTAPVVPTIKEYLKGSSTILILNQDYSAETAFKAAA